MQTNSKEIAYTVSNDFMTENPATCTSVVNPNRVKKSHWKGMNEEQKQAILDIRESQVADAKSKKELEKETARLWASQEEAKREALVKQLLEKQRKEKDMLHALKETHFAQKAEKAAKWTNNYGEKLSENK